MWSIDDHPKLKKLRKEVALLRDQFIIKHREEEDIRAEVCEAKEELDKYLKAIKEAEHRLCTTLYDPLGTPWYDPEDPHPAKYYYDNDLVEPHMTYTYNSCDDDDDEEDEEEERRRRHEEDDEESRKRWDEFERYLEDGYWS